jgi:ribosomal protein S18 acetylase RimI-like enzyme
VTLALRRPRPEEAEELARLHIQCWHEAYRGIVPQVVLENASLKARIATWHRHIADMERIVLAAYDDGKPVGFILAGPPREEVFEGADGQIAAFYILASHQRMGLGKRLLSEAARGWKRQGGTSLGLGVLAENAKARAFYEKMGGKLARTGTWSWDGHPLADATYIFDDLDSLGKH